MSLGIDIFAERGLFFVETSYIPNGTNGQRRLAIECIVRLELDIGGNMSIVEPWFGKTARSLRICLRGG